MSLNINGTTGLTFNNGSAQDVGGVGTGGQTWQTFTRIGGTTYTNTTGKPIFLSIQTVGNNTGGGGTNLTIDGVSVAIGQGYAGAIGMAQGFGLSAIVPNGSTYSITNTYTVAELR
jgi:hypothetical protein